MGLKKIVLFLNFDRSQKEEALKVRVSKASEASEKEKVITHASCSGDI